MVPSSLQQLQQGGLQGGLGSRGGMGLGGQQQLSPSPVAQGGMGGLGGNAAAAAAARQLPSNLASSLGLVPPPMAMQAGMGMAMPPRPGLDRSTSVGMLGLGPLQGGGAGAPLARAPSGGAQLPGGLMNGGRAAGYSPAGVRAGPPAGMLPQQSLPGAAAGSELMALIKQGGGGSGMFSSLLGGSPHAVGPSELESQPFSMSEFPSLGGSRPGSGIGGLLGLGGSLGVMELGGMDLYGKPHPEFSIQNEDFPALPGAPKGSKEGGSGSQAGREMMHHLLQGVGDGVGAGEAFSGRGYGGDDGGSYGAGPPAQGAAFPPLPALSLQQQQAQQRAASLRPGAQQPGKPLPLPSPPGERFGLLGLLSAIRMSDVDLSTLALGTDLTTLGLNLNSSEALYRTFASPWADAPCRPEPDLGTPACYLQQPPYLSAAMLQRFSAEALFYLFYSCPGEDAQLGAAEELASRAWFWHKELKAWLQRAPGAEAAVKAERGERGSYVFFDSSSWERVRKDGFLLDYAQLDETPRPRQQQGQQQQAR